MWVITLLPGLVCFVGLDTITVFIADILIVSAKTGSMSQHGPVSQLPHFKHAVNKSKLLSNLLKKITINYIYSAVLAYLEFYFIY